MARTCPTTGLTARTHPVGTAHRPHSGAGADTGAARRPVDCDGEHSWMCRRSVNDADETAVCGVVEVKCAGRVYAVIKQERTL